MSPEQKSKMMGETILPIDDDEELDMDEELNNFVDDGITHKSRKSRKLNKTSIGGSKNQRSGGGGGGAPTHQVQDVSEKVIVEQLVYNSRAGNVYDDSDSMDSNFQTDLHNDEEGMFKNDDINTLKALQLSSTKKVNQITEEIENIAKQKLLGDNFDVKLDENPAFDSCKE